MPKALPLAASDSLNNQSSSTLDEVQKTIFVFENPESSSTNNNSNENIDNNEDFRNRRISQKDAKLSKRPSISQLQQTHQNIGTFASQPLIDQQFVPNDKQVQQQNILTPTISNKEVTGYDMLMWTPSPSGLLYPDQVENSGLTIIPLEENKQFNPPPAYLEVDIGLKEDAAFKDVLLDIPQSSITNMSSSKNLGIKENENLHLQNTQDTTSLHKAPCQHGFGGRRPLYSIINYIDYAFYIQFLYLILNDVVII